MTTRTTIHCDRCGSDVTDARHWQYGSYEVAGPQDFAVTKGDRVDLCRSCKGALDHFLGGNQVSAEEEIVR